MSAPTKKDFWMTPTRGFIGVSPNELPLCEGDAEQPHEPKQVVPVDRFSKNWYKGRGHRCPICSNFWCKHPGEE